MDTKPTTLRTHLIRLLLIGVFLLLLRLFYVVSTNPSSSILNTSPITTTSSSLRLSSSDPSLHSSFDSRKSVDYYSSVFQDLILDGFLSPSSTSLILHTPSGHEVLSLKELGVKSALGLSNNNSPPLLIAGDIHHQPFPNNTFDFVLLNIDKVNRVSDLAAEIGRVLKPEGFLVILTVSAGDLYSIHSLQHLFGCCRSVRSREIDGPNPSSTVREIVFQKAIPVEHVIEEVIDNHHFLSSGNSANTCPVPDYRRQILMSAESLIQDEPLKPWLTLKRNIKNVKYLPTMADISFKNRYVYVDVGARSYGSSIGSWFKKQYPKQNQSFEVYAIEADKAFHKEYATKKGVTLLPYAAWVKNESLSFEVNHNSSHDEGLGKGMGRIRPSGVPSNGRSSGDLHSIQGFDFAEWLKSTVTEKDFVVMKMDVEGTEFDLIPRLFETGAICLIDEFFLECHYNRWQRCCPGERSPKYQNTYGQCLELFTSLRDSGVLVHQWW